MNTLPIAAFLAREGVERQVKPDQSDQSDQSDRFDRFDRFDRPGVPRRAPVRHTRIAIATALDRATRAVAPAGYHWA
jgi:hypothetical protein